MSAAPNADDLSRAEHRLYAVRDGAEPCSAACWAQMAREEIEEVQGSKRLPVLVGGTGLYLRTLLEGIAPVPRIEAEVRRQVRSAGVAENHTRLRQLDRAAAERLNPADTTRVARALEVILSTGRTLADWQEDRQGGIVDRIKLRPLILLPPRDWLYARCDARFAQMFEGGAVDEVKALLARKLDPKLPIMRAIGVRVIEAFLRGDLSTAEAIAAGQQATRRYAKRQYTWFAHQPPADWPRFTDPIDRDSMAVVLELLHSSA